MRNRWLAVPLLAGAAAIITACGSNAAPTSGSGASSSPQATTSAGNVASTTAVIQTRSTSIGTVLTNAQGHTLYWFAIDTSTKSNCNGACATYWPPVLGTPKAASGASLPMGFGTITRSDGQVQATYDGHPLYTYAADTSAGMTSGNGSNLSGGLWWAMTPNGAKASTAAAPGSSPSSSPSSGSGGGW